jgi:hypothetical protein
MSDNKLNNNYEIYNINTYGAQAYIIRNDVDKKFIKKNYINNKFDITLYNNHTSDGYLFYILKTYFYKYHYFTYSFINDSTIHDSHLAYYNEAKKI